MRLVGRPYRDEADLELIAELSDEVASAGRHLVDWPWRLSAHAPDSADLRLWAADNGLLVGFAAWQVWWATLDFYVRPGPARQEVEDAIFGWAAARFHELDTARGRPLPYWAEAREGDLARLALLARHGYTLEDDYAYLTLGGPLVGPQARPLPRPDPPAGFAIRPLAGAGEVEAYVAVHRRAFASTSMTAAWRARTLRTPRYARELDLVATAPDGRLAGFCVGWAAPERRLAQIEPLGIDPEFQGQGLGRSLLLEMLGRFKAHGAERALVETESSRSPARRVYEAAGLRPIHQSLRKGRWFSRHPGGQDQGAGEDRMNQP